MKNKIAVTIITGALLSLSNAAIAEECFGVVLAGSNDCASTFNSCAGYSLEDG
ncbi:BufA1 family periplasmic bufferin-type metallophore [Candidatus Thioglobus sp.]|uniref:BufA1 family periplasmic bufferin-type metallophore n=1 Tax=Candidatus Thioglobus sp. TaxID=2026721 RepID=UPI003D0C2948